MECSLSNTSISITLPIYWIKAYKTKADQTILMSMNWYRNAFYADQNNAKKCFSELVSDQVSTVSIAGQYRLHIGIYYKNVNCDGSNIAALIEKFILDALQKCGTIVNDNVKYHIGTTWEIIEQDKTNPRCIVTVIQS